MLKKKIIYIDSGNQLTGATNIWVNKLDINFEEEYDRITVLQVQIPVSYYVIGPGANTFTLREGNTSVTISITPANYNVYNFASIVGALMTANSPNGYTYTIAYPNTYIQPDTGLFTYTVNNITTTISLIFPNLNPIADQFGFYNGSTNTFKINGSIQTLVSTAVVNFIPENSLMIHSNVCDGETTSNLSDVLITIYGFNVQPYSTITYVNPCPLETSRRLASRDRNMIFSITDEHNNFISMNGQNVQLILMLYKEPTTDTSIEQYIAMKTKLLELDLKHEKEANVQEEIKRPEQVEADEIETKQKMDTLEERERQLNAREETLKTREESINNLQNNKDNGQSQTKEISPNVESGSQNQA